MTAITDEQIAKAAYEAYEGYWRANSLGDESEAWAASGRAVLALTAPAPAVPSTGERELPLLPEPYSFKVIHLSTGLKQKRPLYTGFQMQDQARATLAAPSHSAPLTDAEAHAALGARGYREAFDAGRRASLPDVKAEDSYREGVNIDRLAQALRAMGMRSWDSMEEAPAVMSDAINRLTRNVIKYVLTPGAAPIPDVKAAEPVNDMFERELKKHGDPTKLSEPMHDILLMFYRAGHDAAAPIKPEPRQAPSDARRKDALLQASIDFIGRLTGMKPPPIEVAPPEVFAPFHAFVTEIESILAAQAPSDALDAARYRMLRAAWLADPDAGEDVAWSFIMHSCDEDGMDADIDAAIRRSAAIAAQAQKEPKS